MDIDTKLLGNKHYENKKKGRKENRHTQRSRNYKDDKARNFRKRLDRESHHRRRNHIRSERAKGRLDIDTVPNPSSTKNCGSRRSNGSILVSKTVF